MMAPTVVLRDGRPEVALGSRRLEPDPLGDPPDAARRGGPRAAGRGGGGAPAHPRRGPRGRGRAGRRRGRRSTQLEQGGWTVRRWAEQNLFFGGVQAVARNPETGELTGGGDPRRGGVRRAGRLDWLDLSIGGAISDSCPMTEPAFARIAVGMAERLSPIDGSFLRVESPNAHMHVAWSATFRSRRAQPRPTLPRLRRHIAARLERVPRFRCRLAWPPPGMGEPFWVEDPDFDVGNHVLPLGTLGLELDDQRFALLCDSVLSAPLDRAPAALGDPPGAALRRRPLRDRRQDPSRARGRPLGRRGRAAAVRRRAERGRRAAGAVGGAARAGSRRGWRRGPSRWGPGSPCARRAAPPAWRASRARPPRGLAGTLRRAALAAGEDLLRPAPASALNARIGPRRTLVRHSVDLERRAPASSAPRTRPSTTSASRWPPARCASWRSPAASGRCRSRRWCP